MKKTICLLLTLALLLALAACGGSQNEGNLTGDLSELLEQVMDGATHPETVYEISPVEGDLFTWIFFIDPIDGAEAVVHQPLNGSIPHSVGLVRVPAGTDPESVRTDIEKNLDPRKWICVEAEKTAVVRRGDVILMAMTTADFVDKAVENFMALPAPAGAGQ